MRERGALTVLAAASWGLALGLSWAACMLIQRRQPPVPAPPACSCQVVVLDDLGELFIPDTLDIHEVHCACRADIGDGVSIVLSRYGKPAAYRELEEE